jgi:Protein of unknown function (DUF429)
LALIQKRLQQTTFAKQSIAESTTKVPNHILGIDFTSAPRKAKAITVAHAALARDRLMVSHVERLESFQAFEVFLNTRGPWIGGFDFPFGLPRELVEGLRWPTNWSELVAHVRTIGKERFKEQLNCVRRDRPWGARYIKRKGDDAAGASSSMKLHHPPVGLMFFEGAARLARAGVSVIPCSPNSDTRVALEAYPGFLARRITRESYKKDGKEGGTPKRVAARETLVKVLPSFAEKTYELTIAIEHSLEQECIVDSSGDTLDAVLCALQAAIAQRAFEAGDPRYGIPEGADDFEGWIATVGAA